MPEKILLHCCCGPCSIMPVIRLKDQDFEPILWFMNPNIQPLAEYLRRRETAGETANHLKVRIIFDDEPWNLEDWIGRQLPWVNSPIRCENCIIWRMERLIKAAEVLKIEIFSSTLLYSRYQPHDFIKKVGESLEKSSQRKFFYQDFRQDWQSGIDKAKEWNLYRQPYCGCVFSETERYSKKLARLKKGQNTASGES